MDVYDDIINMPRHVSKTRKKMMSAERAAQFAPFAALTGYDGVIAEAHRLTKARKEMSEDAIYELNIRLDEISKKVSTTRVKIRVTFFLQDERKSGGDIVKFEGVIGGIDPYESTLNMEGGVRIKIQDIFDIEIWGEDYK